MATTLLIVKPRKSPRKSPRKIRDLPKNARLDSICVEIPRKHRQLAVAAGLTKFKVYVFSQWSHGIWVKEDRNSQRVYPLQIQFSELLDWKVVDC